MFLQIYELIKEFNTIIIHRHERPDGDALGSQIGLKEAIIATFPDKNVFAVGDMIDKYNWMGKMDEIDNSVYENALVIIVDCGGEKLICDERYKLGKYIIKIDHHIAQGEYGNLAYVNTNSESCASIIAEMIFATPLIMNDKSANAIFTGIVTDSGRFRFSSNNSRVYQIVSELMNYHVDTEYIYNRIYIDKLAMVKLRALMVSKFKVTEAGVAYLINTKEDILLYNKEYGTSIFDISRGMVNIMAGIEGIPVWVNFSQDPNSDSIYVEIRANGYNINSVASAHGGGGHLQASGCSINSFEEIETIIEELNVVARGENNE